MKFTDYKHKKVKELGEKWWQKEPQSTEELYEFASFQYMIKDYDEAFKWYAKAVANGFSPAFFQLAYCQKFGLGTKPDEAEAQKNFTLYLQKIKEEGEKSAEDVIRLIRCDLYGYGKKKDEKAALKALLAHQEELADCSYELALAYLDGRLGLEKDKKKAQVLFRKAYDGYVEDAIFKSYEAFEGPYEEYPWKQELTEAYSYRIGEYMRVVHANPSVEACQRLADLYIHGFPGDNGEDDARFKRKALKYLKKIASLQEETQNH